MPSDPPTSPNVEGPDASGPQIRRGGPSPLSHLASLGAEKIEAILHGNDDRLKIAAVRTIAWVEAVHERTQLMRARTEAYIQRCQVLNDRTRATASQPKSPPSSVLSVPSVVKAPPARKKNFGEPLSPGDIDPRTGRVVPEEHELTLPHLTKETEHIGMCMMPGHKTKADYIRAFHAFYKREDRFHSELRAAKSELNVFRSERLGSITLEKREELLAGRYEKNAKRREMYDVPDFVKQFGPTTPPDVPIPPDPVPDKVERDPEGKPLVPLTRRDHEGALDDPTSLPFTGEMSRGFASDREGKSSSQTDESSQRAASKGWSPRPPYPDREGSGSSPSTPLSPPSEPASSVSPHSSSASSVPSSVSSVVGACPDSIGMVKECLSEKAAARRAAGKHPLPPPTPRLIHPTPRTRPP